MRLLQVLIPAGKGDAIEEHLTEEGIDYVLTDETSTREVEGVAYVPLPKSAVEPILDRLVELGVERESYTVVLSAETVESERFDELEERFASDDVDEERISRQELQAEATGLTPSFDVYVTMTVISAVVATAGLLLDSPAVVVGSMVIAPLIGPALAASVGTVVNDDELFKKGLKYQAIGVFLAIGSAAVFAWVVRTLHIVPPGLDPAAITEISERFTPGVLLLAVALGAGVAGVISIATGISVALVGVMIAAALIPPAAAAGIAIAWGLPLAAAGATVLTLVNVISVNLAGLLTLWYAGYRPTSWMETDIARGKFRKHVAAFAVAALVCTAFLGGVTYTSYQLSAFESEAQSEIDDVLSEEYDSYVLADVEFILDDEAEFQQADRVAMTRQVDTVIVTIGVPPDEADPELAERLHSRINQHTDDEVSVQVRFVEITER
ncbi:TIGR00341 family protein [Natronorarus salvus]|uniref:TIGR00341 family protein n=1 Tax=Natronorarus salvus TaxID=3117733 RepID=UPI002F261486